MAKDLYFYLSPTKFFLYVSLAFLTFDANDGSFC
jgi:hypothetical protein